jgi:CHRD domain
MRKFVTSIVLATMVALALAAVSLAGSRTIVWSTKLTAAQEIPKQVVKDAAAHGTFTGTLTGNALAYTLTFSKLTGKAMYAHIHLGAMGVSGNVLVPLCSAATASYTSTAASRPCKSPVKGTVNVTAAMRKDFTKHLLYVNVHTAKNPNGEIRGQLGG